MNLIARAQAVLLKPKDEWVKIKGESTPVMTLFTSYAVLLAAIPAVAKFIGDALIGYRVPFAGWIRLPLGTSLLRAVLYYVLSLVAVYVSGIVVNALAPNFGSKQNPENAMKLIVYSLTPLWVGGVFFALPFLQILATLAGLYSLYLLYLGFQTPMMETPQDKIIPYLVISIVVVAVLMMVVWWILGSFLVMGSVYSGI